MIFGPKSKSESRPELCFATTGGSTTPSARLQIVPLWRAITPFIAWPGGQADIASASIIVRLPDRQWFQDNDLSLFAKELGNY